MSLLSWIRLTSVLLAGTCLAACLEPADDLYAPGVPPGKADGVQTGPVYVCLGWAKQSHCTSKSVSGSYLGIDPEVPVRPIPIYYSVKTREAGSACLRIVDALTGELVRCVHDLQAASGLQRVSWDGTDDAGDPVAGDYFRARVELVTTAGLLLGRSDAHPVRILRRLPPEGPGYYHFLGTDKPDTDNWAASSVMERLLSIGQRWDGAYRIGIGDLSRQNGGPFPPHANHTDGLSVDLRYVHKKGEHTVDLSKCRSSRCRSTYFDQQATERLITLLEEAGATRVITYPSPKLAGAIVEPLWSHGNHMHVDLPDRFPLSAPPDALDGGTPRD